MRTEIAVLSLLAWSAFLVARTFSRRNIPELVAFLLVGAVFGPSGFGLIEERDLRALAPITEIALGVLMFIVGERVSLRALRAARWVLATGFLSYAAASAAVYLVASRLGADPVVALLLAVLAGAGAPMTVASIVTSTRARGRYPSGLVGTHAVCDALAAFAFAAVLPVALFLSSDDVGVAEAAFTFVRLGVGGALLGVALGFVVARTGVKIETTGELLLFVLVHVLVASTVATLLGLSLPLAALVMGAAAATWAPTDTGQRLFVAARMVEQPLYLIFFALAGASIHIEDVPEVGVVGIGYVLARVVAKVFAGTVGGLGARFGFRRSFRLGIDQLPQAGVAVGLAVLAAAALPDEGSAAATVVLGSVVIFELAGPLLVSRSLRALGAGEGDRKATEAQQVEEALPERVLLASSGPLELPAWILDWCARSSAELIVLTGADREADGHDIEALATRAAAENVPLRSVPMAPDESFTSGVVRVATDMHADLVAVVVPNPVARSERWRRIGSHERLTRQLACPVLLVKAGPAAERAAERQHDRPEEQPAEGGPAVAVEGHGVGPTERSGGDGADRVAAPAP